MFWRASSNPARLNSKWHLFYHSQKGKQLLDPRINHMKQGYNQTAIIMRVVKKIIDQPRYFFLKYRFILILAVTSIFH
jgi:hypothetical protein